jgi:hydrogenase maturation protein HypF
MGAVQGVGFRPFVYRLANELNLKGWVVNSAQGVFIDAEGDENSLNGFIGRIETDKPKNSFFQSSEHSFLDPFGYTEFEIRESKESGAKTAIVLPDIATCEDCLNEIFDPLNRRYLYPFTNCTNCGPRFSIIKSLPYDRKNTTMAEFEMCGKCRAEYSNPLDRRFHAEPTACPDCGPQVSLLNNKGETLFMKHEAILKTSELLKQGKIIALKGVGGFQLLADAGNEEAVKLLRKRKRRSEKPFALMFVDINSVKNECEVSAPEERLLKSTEAPIVLLKRKKDINSQITGEVSINNPYFGIMLPYSPLHHILMQELNIPVVATSGNISEEPICIDETEALENLNGIADYYLIHNRKIMRHVDDSIARITAGRESITRRARGYAPLPIQIDGAAVSSLAVGAHLKNTIAVNKNNNVFISQHIGDLENVESSQAFQNVIKDLQNFYEIKPARVICDMHPEYISTKYAEELNIDAFPLQHHFAHVLSCIAENEITGSVLGVSWDGTGYGTDGTIWGSEFLIVNESNFKRIAHLKPFRLAGGEKAITEIRRIGFALLYEVFGEKVFELTNLPVFKDCNFNDLKLFKQMIDKGINSPVTTSMGRLFDGIASIIGLRQEVNFEAQAAMELEFATDDLNLNDYFDFDIEKTEGVYLIKWNKLVEEILADFKSSVSKNIIALKFHNTLSEIIVNIAKLAGEEKVILTGGCFQNKYLLEKTINRLTEESFKVYWHQRVPANDGGISLGQIKYSTYLK